MEDRSEDDAPACIHAEFDASGSPWCKYRDEKVHLWSGNRVGNAGDWLRGLEANLFQSNMRGLADIQEKVSNDAQRSRRSLSLYAMKTHSGSRCGVMVLCNSCNCFMDAAWTKGKHGATDTTECVDARRTVRSRFHAVQSCRAMPAIR